MTFGGADVGLSNAHFKDQPFSKKLHLYTFKIYVRKSLVKAHKYQNQKSKLCLGRHSGAYAAFSAGGGGGAI